MQRREFCKSTLAVAVAATLPGCGSDRSNGPDTGRLIPAVDSNGSEISIESVAVRELGDSLDGRLFLQSDEGYNAAKRVWNGMFDDKKPAMVVQCASTDDVVQAVNFARERNLLVSVKCGGHSLPGKSTSDGGLMIDLSPMHEVDVDVEAMTMRADGGCLLGHLDQASLAHNLLTTTGIVAHTGAGGFTLGGGFGRTDRVMGLAVDNLLAATVVTAAGDVVRTSEDENPDLLWGLRGGGGNFGVATEFLYRLHPFNPTYYGGVLVYELNREFLDFYAGLHDSLPDEANIEPQFVPGEDGKRIVVVEVTWSGDHAAGEKALAVMTEYPGLLDGELGAHSYLELQTSADEFLRHGRQYYLKSGLLEALTPDVMDVIAEFAPRDTLYASWFQHLGGSVGRVAPEATAFVHRNAAFNFGIMYIGDDPAQNDTAREQVRDFYAALEPYFIGFYNNLNEDSERRTWGNYGPNYPRLVELKDRYDPTNLFRLNANIRPTV